MVLSTLFEASLLDFFIFKRQSIVLCVWGGGGGGGGGGEGEGEG